VASVSFHEADIRGLLDDMALAYRNDVAEAIILPMMRSETPVDTGVLKQQTRVDPGFQRTATGYKIVFRAMPYWGVFVQEGHGVIVPVKAKVLRFVTKLGKVVFTKRVGPVPANPYMYRTFLRAGLYEVKRVFR
jgi:hypothetical protein